MDQNDKLKWLCERAELAKKLTGTLTELTMAEPYKSGARRTFNDWNTNSDFLDDEILKKVVAEGRLTLNRETTKELESVLAVASNDDIGPAPEARP